MWETASRITGSGRSPSAAPPVTYNRVFCRPTPVRILLVKTSSLGDVIHNLPVVTDLQRQFPGAVIDWVVEAPFADIPRLHPGVNRVLTVAVRRWRKRLTERRTWTEMAQFRRHLRRERYDAIIDTQGLLKSALIASLARGLLLGYDANSAREPLASRLYSKRFAVDRRLHAVERNRLLAASALDYGLAAGSLDYGLAVPRLAADWIPASFGVLLTATSRDDKLWPEADWIGLGQRLATQGITPVLPAGSDVERARAARIAAAIPGAIAAPSLSVQELAGLLAGARLAVGVDTGLTHLAAALRVPTVAIYTATEPGLTGVLGTGFHCNLGGKRGGPPLAEVAAAAFDALAAGSPGNKS